MFLTYRFPLYHNCGFMPPQLPSAAPQSPGCAVRYTPVTDRGIYHRNSGINRRNSGMDRRDSGMNCRNSGMNRRNCNRYRNRTKTALKKTHLNRTYEPHRAPPSETRGEHDSLVLAYGAHACRIPRAMPKAAARSVNSCMRAQGGKVVQGCFEGP